MDNLRVGRFDYQRKQKYPFSKWSRPALGPTQHTIEWVLEVGVGVIPLEQSEQNVRLTANFNIVLKFKNEWSYASNHPILLHGL
jgi:hypothetical protein